MTDPLAARTFKLECSTAMGLILKSLPKKTDIEKTDGNNLMAKAMAPKSLTMMTISTSSMIKFHGKHFYGKFPTVESPAIKTMTFIGLV